MTTLMCVSFDAETGEVVHGVEVTCQQYQPAIGLREGKSLLQAARITLPERLLSRWKASNKFLLLNGVALRKKGGVLSYHGLEETPDLASHALLVARVNSQSPDVKRVFLDDRGQSLDLVLSGHQAGYAHMMMNLPAGKIIAIRGEGGIHYAFFNGRVLWHTTAIGRTLNEGFDVEAAAVLKETAWIFPRKAYI